MTPNHERDQLLAAYLLYAEAACKRIDDEANYWADDVIRDIVDEDPEAAWSLVVELVTRAEDDRLLAFIAAGPLEDLIAQHGKQLIDRIEARAAKDKKFLRALSGVWGESRMAEDVLRRVKYLVRNEPPF